MEQREKLIELMTEVCIAQFCNGKEVREELYVSLEDIETIADYLLANGVVVLPFKVGDAVWSALPFTDGKIREGYISVFLVDEDGAYSFYASFGVEPISAEFLIDEIGKTVFFTKEEAEKALEKRKAVTSE